MCPCDQQSRLDQQSAENASQNSVNQQHTSGVVIDVSLAAGDVTSGSQTQTGSQQLVAGEAASKGSAATASIKTAGGSHSLSRTINTIGKRPRQAINKVKVK